MNNLEVAALAAPPTPRQTRVRWSPRKKRAFRELEPSAVYIAGNSCPEPRRFGDNRGAWPILTGATDKWEDNISRHMDRLSPLSERRLLFRIWTLACSADALLGLVRGYINDRIEQGTIERLRGSWLDFGPDTDLALFEFEIHGMARDQGLLVWDDSGLSQHLDDRVSETTARAVRRR